jgi:hypothetical protein
MFRWAGRGGRKAEAVGEGAPQKEVSTKQPIQQANAHGGSQVSGKAKLQGLILVVGLICAIIAYGTTPKVWNGLSGSTEPCRRPYASYCYAETPTAIARGGGVLLLAIVAFGGVAVVIKDD